MSGRGKARKAAGGKKHTKSNRAGLVISVSRVHRYMKKGRYARRTSIAASVYMSAVIEYLVAEVNELSGNAAKANKRVRLLLETDTSDRIKANRHVRKTITPRHIMLGVRNDAELNELLKHVHISHGGVLPCIHPALLKRKGVLTNSPGQGGAAISGTSLSSRQASSGITSSAMVTS